jgi:hypothetical protein
VACHGGQLPSYLCNRARLSFGFRWQFARGVACMLAGAANRIMHVLLRAYHSVPSKIKQCTLLTLVHALLRGPPSAASSSLLILCTGCSCSQDFGCSVLMSSNVRLLAKLANAYTPQKPYGNIHGIQSDQMFSLTKNNDTPYCICFFRMPDFPRCY